LAPRLGHAVVFALEEVEAADQRDHGAVLRIQSDDRALHLRNLHELQVLRGAADRIDHIAAAKISLAWLGQRSIFSSGSSRRAQEIFSQGSVTGPRI
jgi:hypothetical protein